jgi:hypothetical protein
MHGPQEPLCRHALAGGPGGQVRASPWLSEPTEGPCGGPSVLWWACRPSSIRKQEEQTIRPSEVITEPTAFSQPWHIWPSRRSMPSRVRTHPGHTTTCSSPATMIVRLSASALQRGQTTRSDHVRLRRVESAAEVVRPIRRRITRFAWARGRRIPSRCREAHRGRGGLGLGPRFDRAAADSAGPDHAVSSWPFSA